MIAPMHIYQRHGYGDTILNCLHSGSPKWIAEMEESITRKLGPMKRGPEPKAWNLV